MSKHSHRAEKVNQQSAAEFFSEHQQIAGFDNPGKSLFTTIRELVETVAEVVGYRGDIHWDTSKPDGTPRKLMDSSKLASMGWSPQYYLKTGLKHAYTWYLGNIEELRAS